MITQPSTNYNVLSTHSVDLQRSLMKESATSKRVEEANHLLQQELHETTNEKSLQSAHESIPSVSSEGTHSESWTQTFDLQLEMQKHQEELAHSPENIANLQKALANSENSMESGGRGLACPLYNASVESSLQLPQHYQFHCSGYHKGVLQNKLCVCVCCVCILSFLLACLVCLWEYVSPLSIVSFRPLLPCLHLPVLQHIFLSQCGSADERGVATATALPSSETENHCQVQFMWQPRTEMKYSKVTLLASCEVRNMCICTCIYTVPVHTLQKLHSCTVVLSTLGTEQG